MSSTVILKAAGLHTSPNELDRPDGALIEASNVIIKRDGIIEQRRGFSLYGSELTDTTARVKQLTTYRNRLIRHFSDSLQFDSDAAGNFQTFTGNFMETALGLRMKFIESNGNLYFTTEEGIKKISARNADDFTTDSGFVTSAGAIKAVDLTGKALYTANSQGAWFPQDSAVAYRTVWAYTDLNNNLIQGAPSQRLVISNPMIGLLIRDYTRVLSTLDNFTSSTSSTRISDGDYVKILGLTLNATANELYNNLISLAKKLDTDVLYATQVVNPNVPLNITSASIDSGIGTINFTGLASGYLSSGSKIYLDGFNLETRQEIQTVKFSANTTTGSFKLKYGLSESAAINWDDSLNTTNERITFNIAPTGGSYTLKYGVFTSASIAYNATLATIQTTIRAISGLSDVVVTSGARTTTSGGGTDTTDYSAGLTLSKPSNGGITTEITIGTNSLTPTTVITTALSNSIQSKIRAVSNLDNVVVTGAINLSTGLTLTFPTTDGDLNQVNEGSLNTLGVSIATATTQSGIKTVSGDINKGQIVSSVNEIQKISFTPAAASGSFKVSFNEYESVAINYNAVLATVQAAINAVIGLQNAAVSVVYDTGKISEISIDFGANSSKGSAISVTSNTTGSTVAISSTSLLKFNTTAVGKVTLTNATIYSNEYRSITQPTEPDLPATNDQLVELQTYLENIITRLSAESETVISSEQKITFSVTPTSGSFKLKYGTLYSPTITLPTTDAVIETQLRTLTGLQNIQVSGSFATGFTLFSPDGLKSTITVENSTLTPTTVPATSTSDILSLDDIALTTTATTELTITIPQGINSNYFLQVYRTSVAQATGVNTFDDLVPNEEYQLVYEAYPTASELAVSSITFEDVTPDAFRGANLYTNASTGEGILQSNEIPPFAKDINRYRNSIFYANTRTRQQLLLSLLGVTNMIADYDAGNTPSITISNGTKTNTYSFVTGQQEITDVTVSFAGLSPANVTGLNSKYFLISSVNTDFYVWFDYNSTGTDPKPTTPALSTKTGIQVNISTGDTEAIVAQKIKDVLSTYLEDFIPTVSGSTITVTNYSFGVANDAAPGNSTFTINKIADGRSEDEATLSVLLSTVVSPARAVDETAKSLVRIINKNPNESVYAYYLSSAYDVPGKIFLQARQLEQTAPFYVLGNNSITGTSFNPEISPVNNDIVSISVGLSGLVTTTSAHGLITGDQVMLTDTNSTPSANGLFTATVNTPTSFYINKTITVASTSGAFIKAADGTYSENEERANRVYYSKFQQPEAVPSTNYFDVGAQDKAILRILPLRTSLFVFKEDGLYRISGESAPFQLELFDISFNVLAPDSVVVCNNVIYAWTTQGIQSLTEGGASIISRSIDNIILKTQSSNFTNFKTATWGVGYESDNSYIVFTVKEENDEYARIAYRFSTLTNTWTTYDLSHISGCINSADDKLYISASDVAYIEKERKTFSRLDYADREIDSVISANKLLADGIVLPNITGISVGDVFTQDQTITTTNFNMLLEKLDLDSGVTGSDYFSTLKLLKGKSPRDQLESLAVKLDADTVQLDEEGDIVSPGVNFSSFFSKISAKSGLITAATAGNSCIITSANHGLITGRVISITGSLPSSSIDGIYPVTVINSNTFSIPLKLKVAGTAGNWQTINGDFNDLKTCFNFIVTTLNADTGVSFNNYTQITHTTLMEAIITDINTVTRKISLNLDLDFIIGDVVIYEAFESSFMYSPVTFGDPLMLKHLREATMMFETRTLTSGILSFRTDLLPELISVPFNLDGNGIFGHVSNYGDGFFGGLSNSAPFRTYIPRQCQRCRYILVRFSHSVAREDYRVNGCTLTGEVAQSSKAYR